MLVEMYGLDNATNKHDDLIQSSVISSIKHFRKKHGHRPIVIYVNPSDTDIYHVLCRIKNATVIQKNYVQARHFHFAVIKRKPVLVIRREPV